MTAPNMGRRSHKTPRRMWPWSPPNLWWRPSWGPGKPARRRRHPCRRRRSTTIRLVVAAAAEVARADDPAVQVNEAIAAQIAEFDDVGRRAGELVEAAASKSDAGEHLRVALDRESNRLSTGTVRFVDTPHDDLGQQMSE